MDTKTNIFNLIILDESGSMSGTKEQTISGCNETIETIRNAQKQYEETQNHYVSIYVFQSGRVPSRYLIKNLPANDVSLITAKDYNPGGCTPLFDAMGATLTDLKVKVDAKDLAIGSVTIITDGEENSSQHYSYEKITRMISALKEVGWNFNFIGANIDVYETARSLGIDNALQFEQTEEGERAMYNQERVSRMNYYGRMDQEAHSVGCAPMSKKERHRRMREAQTGYFNR